MDSKCANTPISATSLDQNVSIIFVNNINMLGILEQSGTKYYT